MTKRTRIKICGIQSQDTLKTLVELGVDAFGLMFYEKSKRGISVKKASEIVKNIPPFIDCVAVFVNPDRDSVIEVIRHLPITVLQFHGDEPEAFCQQFELPYIKALRFKPNMDLNKIVQDYHSARALLCDTEVNGQFGGTGQAFNWQHLPKAIEKPLILAGGLTPDNVGDAIHVSKPYAVDVSGGVENELCQKDDDKIKQFVEAVKKADIHESS